MIFPLFECTPHASDVVRRPKRGFSLVEVMMAIGLATFALAVIFSIIPVGLVTLQEAHRQMVETDVFHTLGAELATTPSSLLRDYETSRFPVYFNNEGAEVSAADEAVFTVRCALADPEGNGGKLRRATLAIGYRSDPDQGGTVKAAKRTFLLVDRGT